MLHKTPKSDIWSESTAVYARVSVVAPNLCIGKMSSVLVEPHRIWECRLYPFSNPIANFHVMINNSVKAYIFLYILFCDRLVYYWYGVPQLFI